MEYDSLHIGQLMTERYLENSGLIESKSLEKLYDLLLRYDLVFDSVGVKHLTDDDITSKVFEVIESTHSKMKHVFSDESITSLDREHRRIHEGHHFSISTILPLLASATIYQAITTGDKYIHMTFSIDSVDAGVEVTSFENVVPGTLVTQQVPINNNRNSLNVSDTNIRMVDSLNLTGSLQMFNARLGTATNPAQKSGGTLTRTNERVLKPNTTYAIRILNLSTLANNVNLNLSWYEEDESI